MHYQFLDIQISDGIARLWINRPEKLNALREDVQTEILGAVTDMDKNDQVRVITLQGRGRAFSAGGDLSGPPESATAEEIARQRQLRDNIRWDIQDMERLSNRFSQILSINKPIIAGIHGYCLGEGTDLALHCDIIIASEDVMIGYPPVRGMGSPPTHMWTYMVGPQWAKWFLLTGSTINGKEAAEIGLVLKAVPEDALASSVESLAVTMAKIPWEVLAANKSIVNKAMDLMGRGPLQHMAAQIDAVAHHTWFGQEFRRIASESGLKEALEWRDRPFKE